MLGKVEGVKQIVGVAGYMFREIGGSAEPRECRAILSLPHGNRKSAFIFVWRLVLSHLLYYNVLFQHNLSKNNFAFNVLAYLHLSLPLSEDTPTIWTLSAVKALIRTLRFLPVLPR